MPYRTYPDGRREEISMEEFQRELAKASGPITVTPVIRNPDGTYRKDTFWERLEAQAAEEERAYQRERAREERLQREYERKQREAEAAAEKERLFRQKAQENGIPEKDWNKYRIYLDAQQSMQREYKSSVEEAERKFRSISGWMDADSLADACVLRIKELAEKEEQARIRREEEQRKADLYQKAKSLIALNYDDADKCREAIAIFKELGDYSDSASKVKESKKQLTEIRNRNFDLVMEKIRFYIIMSMIGLFILYIIYAFVTA